jgi:glycosyltransferase involved in cell wall biosynthesis
VLGCAAVIVNPEDVMQMTKEMLAVAGSEEARARLRDAGLEQARKFDWKSTASQTLSVYEKAKRRL